jgi:CheY-like chemotaxis protein
MVILYADDDEDDREIFASLIQQIDPAIILLQAEDGFHAMNILSNGDLPDIIFLDINMPVLDGYETLAEIRKDERFSDIRVIMFSTVAYQKSFDKYLGLKAKYVSKPVSIDDGLEILRAALATA